MNNRNHVRYGSEQLPGIYRKVTLSWQGSALEGSYAVNYSAQGITVVIPAPAHPREIPVESATIRVQLPVNQRWFNGRCVHCHREADGSLSMGIHFDDPGEGEYLQTLLFNALKVPEHSFVSYEWEELVGKLCSSDDPKLQQLGMQHLAQLRARQGEHQAV
ncbi:hypothetical protein GMLC_07660 [Geomonas limicola]|uniref:Uncharacterized protein n=1 Tax=Geomonas limicola TaxID=2740186 RepID=A0A6V8N5T9_9BACT|nr:PilZ domain-containing protein [Geomonas limicola]GFO67187.1 hypothetical protein GMLC_07660 [Geomonas limicola]